MAAAQQAKSLSLLCPTTPDDNTGALILVHPHAKNKMRTYILHDGSSLKSHNAGNLLPAKGVVLAASQLPDVDDADGVKTTEGAVMVEVVMEEIALPACRGKHLNLHGGSFKMNPGLSR